MTLNFHQTRQLKKLQKILFFRLSKASLLNARFQRSRVRGKMKLGYRLLDPREFSEAEGWQHKKGHVSLLRVVIKLSKMYKVNDIYLCIKIFVYSITDQIK